jgi:hypothetical protein
LFTHYDDPGKCEWRGGALDAFVQHYNEISGTKYELTKCLDVVRISGVTPKEPEVLLTDMSTSTQMVIERKSVVWPKSYLYQHDLGHEFAGLIWKGAKGRFHEAGYKLSIRSDELRALSGKQVRDAGKQIGDAVSSLTPADLPIQRAQPIKWWLRVIEPGEEEQDFKGIAINEFGSMGLDDSKREEAVAGIPSEIQEKLNAAVEKFQKYEKQVKLVLLDFYSEDLWEDDIPPMMNQILIPEMIDEIWRTTRDWVSADDYEVGYDRLHKSSS